MKRVLFIDVRNTARSPIAEAWFNQLAFGWGRAFSCGTMPAKHFDMLAVQVMAEVGAPIRPHLPHPVTQQLLARADLIVMMGHDVPARAFPHAVVWNFPDPTGEHLSVYRQLRDEILASVRELIAELHPVAPDLLPVGQI